METNNERRLRKLILLCGTHGTSAVAEKADLKPVYLEQILKRVKLPEKGDGSRSERALGDSAARAIEEAYALGRGWFDNDRDEENMMTPKEQELMALYRQLSDDPVVQDLIVESVRQAVSDRSRSLERLKPAAAGNTFLGGRSGFGELDGQPTTRAKRGIK